MEQVHIRVRRALAGAVIVMVALVGVGTPTAVASPVAARLTDIRPGPLNSAPQEFAEYNGQLYFIALTESLERAIFRTDGMTVTQVSAPFVGSPRDFTVFDGWLYFAASSELGVVDGVNVSNDELWRTDGTTVELAVDIEPGLRGSNPARLAVIDGRLYFSATTSVNGSEPYVYDGGATMPVPLGDLRPGPNGSFAANFVQAGSAVVFSADDGATGEELWVTDGTAPGTHLLSDINPGAGTLGPNGSLPREFVAFDDTTWFAATGPDGRELWSTDGATATQRFDINDTEDEGSFPQFLTVLGSHLYFSAAAVTTQSQLFRTDGSVVEQLTTLPTSSFLPGPAQLTVSSGNLYFTADEGVHGREVWRYDGGAAAMVADVWPGPHGSLPQRLADVAGMLYLLADDGVHGSEPWRLDGASARLAADIHPGAVPSQDVSGSQAVAFAGAYMTRGNDGSFGNELWRVREEVTAPDVDAGPAASGPAGTSIALSGSAADDGGSPSTAWSILSSTAGSCSFADAATLLTTVTCTEAGTAVTRLTADDGTFTVTDDTIVTVSESNDSMPPVTTASTTPAVASPSGWFLSTVGVDLDAVDGVSGVAAITYSVNGDPPVTDSGATTSFSLTADGEHSVAYFATDVAGNVEASATLIVKIDQTPPAGVTFSGGPADGVSYPFGAVPAVPTCLAADATSGLDSCVVTGYSPAVGGQTMTATATDVAGNQTTLTRSYTVTGWTNNGFKAPVNMSGDTIVYNQTKGGSTVPLKFEVFDGTVELTDVADLGAGLSATPQLCGDGVSDAIEVLEAGKTELRYDASAGHFVFDWKTPKKRGCYLLTLELADASTIEAYFRLR